MDVVRVLVVDDHEPFRDALVALLGESAGFVVVGAVASGEEALSAVRALGPSLVLMDVHLPGLSGVQTTRLVRSGAEDAPVVLLMSTYAEDEVDWRSCGAAGFAAKGELGPGLLLELWDEAGRA